MIKLSVFEKNEPFTELEIHEDEEVSIGRSDKNRLVLKSDRISREHCKIHFSSGKWKVTDLESYNGTRINDKKIDEAVINDGDIIQLPEFTIEIAIQGTGPEVQEVMDSEATVIISDKTVFVPRPDTSPAENSIEIINGEQKGEVHPLDDSMLIGRKSTCDLCINDDSVSREHLLITRVPGKDKSGSTAIGAKYEIKNVSKENVTLLNDKIIKKASKIKDQDIIKIGNTTLNVRLYEKDKPYEKVGRYEKDIKGVFQDILTRKKTLMKIGIVALGLFVILLMFIILKQEPPDQKANDEKSIIKKEQVIEDAELRRRVALYLKSGKDLFEKQDFSQALVRFQGVLDADPTNKDAIRYASLCKEKIEEENRIQRMKEEKDKELKNRVSNLINKARELLQKGEYAEAKLSLLEARSLSPSDKNVANLFKKIEDKLKEQEVSLQEKAHRKAQLLAQMSECYITGKKYYDQGKYYPALKELKKIVLMGPDCIESANARRMVTNAQTMIPKLKAMLMKRAKTDYDKGIKYYNRKKYEKAFIFLQKVVDINPEYKNVKEIHIKVAEILEEKAKKLYQEGLVYEGIGQIDKAKKKWKAVITTIPLESSEYYQKASSKLQR